MAEAAKADQVQISGKVVRMLREDPETGFVMFRCLVNGKQMTVRGTSIGIAEGKDIEAVGDLKPSKNPMYPDPTFFASSIAEIFPKTEDGIRKYLASGFIPNIGPAMADALVKHFGVELFDVIRNNPARLSEVKSIGEKRVKALIDAWKENRALNEIMPFMMANGFGPALSVRVYREFGDNAVSRIKKNPYSLLAVPLIGFERADAFALSLGVARDSEERVRAGVRHAMDKEAENGHTAVAKVRLLEIATKLLGISAERVQEVLEVELKEQKYLIQRDLAGGVTCVSSLEHASAEQAIARRLVALAADNEGGSIGFSEDHPTLHHLDADQREAVRIALSNKVAVITGRPGCGKTTVSKAIIDLLEEAGFTYQLCAPTGRASKRMNEATGYPAATMHRVLGHNGTGFNFNESNPLPFDVILTDEWSMVDTSLANYFVRAVEQGTHLIIVGDPEQLPSIGAGNILADIIQSGVVPVATLTKIHRQAMDSSIIVNAHKIINGEEPVQIPGKQDFEILACHDPEKHTQFVIEQYDRLRAEGFRPEDIQVLTPVRKKTALGSEALNIALKNHVNPAAGKPTLERGGIQFSMGDRVMQTANNKDLGIYNGDIGYIRAVDTKLRKVLVDFGETKVELDAGELDDLDLAYATTIHKSQGSEFPAVIIPVAKSHSFMLNRNLLYTAATRGKKRVMMVGDSYMLKKVVEKADSGERMTGLRDCLIESQENAASNQSEVERKLGSGTRSTCAF